MIKTNHRQLFTEFAVIFSIENSVSVHFRQTMCGNNSMVLLFCLAYGPCSCPFGANYNNKAPDIVSDLCRQKMLFLHTEHPVPVRYLLTRRLHNSTVTAIVCC